MTLAPRRASRVATVDPAGPPPTTITSHSFADGFVIASVPLSRMQHNRNAKRSSNGPRLSTQTPTIGRYTLGNEKPRMLCFLEHQERRGWKRRVGEAADRYA